MKGFEAHTLNLHEDMAEVEYIFSDKTGTLTQNELVFRSMSIVNDTQAVRVNHDSMNETSLKDVENAKAFFECIAFCQDCICVMEEGKLRYSGSSVDEVCLLQMALDLQYMGYLQSRS